MIKIALCFLLCLIVFSFACFRKYDKVVAVNQISVAFYNLDNLFDDIDDTDHDDDDFTPAGKYQWTKERYQQKLDNMATVISKMVNKGRPDVLGVCELESKKALEDLLATGQLKGHYGIVHYDSPDERGIDVALAYNKDKLIVLGSKKINVVLSKNLKDRTRDQLYVKAILKTTGDTIHFYVCHFPSRKEGKDESEINRLDAARTCKHFLDSAINCSRQNLIIMGDFNDQPWDKSISRGIGAMDIRRSDSADLLNLMWGFKSEGRGTYKFKGSMNTLDQFMISKALNDGRQLEYETNSVDIFDESWLVQKGKYDGYPLRTFGGNKWLNGYSDHFAVYMLLKL